MVLNSPQCMTTKFIGMREFRDHLAKYTKKAKKGVRYVVLRKNVPVLEVKPIDEKQFAMERLSAEIEEAEQNIREGKFYTQEEILKEFGLT